MAKLGVRAYARHRGVTHPAVLKAIKAGRIKRGADGLIDAAKADKAWGERTHPVQGALAKRAAPAGGKGHGAGKEASPGSPPAQGKRAPGGDGTSPPGANPLGDTFFQARTMLEVAKANRQRIEVKRLEGGLVDRQRAASMVFALARQERESWKNWATREAPRMAADMGIAGVDAALLQTTLEAYVRKHLGELTAIAPDFR